MTDRISAVLVHENSETMVALQKALERQGVRIVRAESCAHAKRLLGGLSLVPLVFTDAQLSDGSWVDVLEAAAQAAEPVNVIVVARIVDTRFYVEAIETGAFDFLVPPFNATDLAYVLRSAVENVAARRASCGAPALQRNLYAATHDPTTQPVAR